jgi:hypothetical protein
MYELIRFGSFVIAIKLFDWFNKLIVQYLPNQQPFVQLTITYVVVFIAALEVIPEFACLLYKSTMPKQQ